MKWQNWQKIAAHRRPVSLQLASFLSWNYNS
jgi:hypothetical protein